MDAATYKVREMSTQAFSAIEREAIWQAYGRKCVYSHELLDLGNFHIDHILPEMLVSDPTALAAELVRLGLPSTFDLLGFENLVPCKPDRNLQKGSIRLDPGPAQFFLGIASSKKQSVHNEIARIEKRLTAGKAAIMLQKALDSGKLELEQAARILQEYSGQPEEIFGLLESMSLVGAEDIRAVRRGDLDALEDLPVKLGQNTHIDGVELTGAGGQKRLCRTCREYNIATREGFYAASTYDMTMAVFFNHQCGLLTALKGATIPTKSFVSEPRVSLLDLDLVPYSFFPVVTRHEPDAHLKTYQAKVDSGELVVRRVRSNLLVIEAPRGMSQMLLEITRADFNGDGLEDILLFEYCRATEGTYRYGGVKYVTRTSADALFSDLTPSE